MYKAVLQHDLLQDPDEGVNYFKNTLKKYFLKGATNVYLYRLLSFFNHRMQNQEFLIFTSKFEIILVRLKAAWMDLMPVFTAQSFRQSVQDAFRKSGSGGKANMANENYDPYDQACSGKGKGKKGKKGKSKFQYPYDGNKGYPPYENGRGKGGHDKGKSQTFAAIAEKTEEQPAIQQTAPSTEPTYAGWTDQDWDQSWTWNEQGCYSSYETSSTGQALMAFHDAYEHHEKEAFHGKLIQSDAVSEHNLSVTTKHRRLSSTLSAIRPMRSWTTDVPDPWAAGMRSSVLLRQSNP